MNGVTRYNSITPSDYVDRAAWGLAATQVAMAVGALVGPLFLLFGGRTRITLIVCTSTALMSVAYVGAGLGMIAGTVLGGALTVELFKDLRHDHQHQQECNVEPDTKTKLKELGWLTLKRVSTAVAVTAASLAIASLVLGLSTPFILRSRGSAFVRQAFTKMAIYLPIANVSLYAVSLAIASVGNGIWNAYKRRAIARNGEEG